MATYFHGTKHKFDQLDLAAAERDGIFFSPDIMISMIYCGAVEHAIDKDDFIDVVIDAESKGGLKEGEYFDMYEGRREELYSVLPPEEIPDECRILVTDINTRDFVEWRDADEWLRDRGLHPEDEPGAMDDMDDEERMLREEIEQWDIEYDEADNAHDRNELLDRINHAQKEVDNMFWNRYQPPEQFQEIDTFWGAKVNYLKHNGVPGIRMPDTSRADWQHLQAEGEVMVFDLDRVNVIGEVHPKSIVMRLTAHNTLHEPADEVASILNDYCEDYVKELLDARDSLANCNGECANERKRLDDAIEALDECAESETNAFDVWDNAIHDAGGQEILEQIRINQPRKHDHLVVQEIDYDINYWPPKDYQDPSLADESIGQSVANGYIKTHRDENTNVMPRITPFQEQPGMTIVPRVGGNAIDQSGYSKRMSRYGNGKVKWGDVNVAFR